MSDAPKKSPGRARATRKLALEKTTIRDLTATELRGVAGGFVAPSIECIPLPRTVVCVYSTTCPSPDSFWCPQNHAQTCVSRRIARRSRVRSRRARA